MKKRIRKLLTLCALLLTGAAAAQECNWELEPNNLPHQANLLTITPTDGICMSGDLPGSDQDVFLLEVDENLAGHIWVVELEGFDQGLTRLDIMQLEFLENQVDVTSRTNLLAVQSLYGSMTASDPFLLAPGRYWLGFSKDGGSGEYVAYLRSVGTARLAAGSDQTGPKSGPFSTSGELPDGLELAWQIAGEDADILWRLELQVPLRESAELVLRGPSGTIGSARTDGTGFAMLDGFGLGAGDFTVSVNGELRNHLLTVTRSGRQANGQEVEPNNSRETANLFPAGTEMRGSVTDADWFRIDLTADGSWDLTLGTSASLNVQLTDSAGTVLLERNNTAADLRGLTLAQGTYYLQVTGSSGTTYSLALQPGSPAAAAFESEPNDRIASASAISADGQLRGELAERDTDILSFEVSGEPQLYRAQLVGTGSANLELSLLNGAGSSQASVRGQQRLRMDNLQLLAGTHYFRVTGDPGEYALRLLPLGPVPEVRPEDLPAVDEPLQAAAPATERQTAEEAAAAPEQAVIEPPPPPPAGIIELEPNDDTTRAMLLTPGIPRVGMLHSSSDLDYYRFFLAEDQPVRLEIVGPANVAPIPMNVSGHGWIEAARGAEPGTPVSADLWLLAGDHYVEVRRVDTEGGWYQLRLTQLNSALPREADTADLPVAITLSSAADEVAAYWHQGQQVSMTAELRNTGNTPLNLQLNAGTSDIGVSVEVQDTLSLAAGASATVPLTVSLPADLRDDLPLNVSLAAISSEGASGGQLALQPRCEVLPLNPRDWWAVPDSMLGRFNVLWRSFGADLYGSHSSESRARALFDGMVGPAGGSWTSHATTEEMVTVAIAGDAATELVGIVIHPLTDRSSSQQLRNFRVEVSENGTSFTTVFEGVLKSARADQAFMFDRPVRARYLRLVGLDDHEGRTAGGYLGELRVIATDPNLFGGLDLADHNLGGHVVWSEPHTANNTFLREQSRPARPDVRPTDGSFTFVMGFHNTRAAQLTHLEWQDFAEGITSGEALPAVTVEVSMTGAAGPWEELADWEFERGADGTAVLEFEEPVWARYLRFSGTAATPGQRSITTPQRVSAFERAADGSNYLSVLGEWGTASPEAVYEYLNPAPVRVDSGPDDNDTMQTATPLRSGEVAEGTVLVGEDIDWYRFSIAANENQLTIQLSGEPMIAYDFELVDAAGAPVAASVSRRDNSIRLTLFGDPGDYFLRIEEPRRSVVFTWDTSGSMGPYRDITYNALTAFSTGVSAERERVQLLAYEDPPRGPQWLLPLWTGDAARLQRTVVNYERDHDSSNSESALFKAVQALGQRDGTRALFVITDAETYSYELTTDVWRRIEDVQPRIFTFEVSSGGNLRPQQLMQGWAAANHGHYSLAASIGDLDNGFNRANCILRRPKHYRLEVQTAAAAAPGPGSLRVVRPEDALQPAVQVIFDASGSMGTTLPSGEQRITAAKRVLEDLVSGGLPAGSPFALRAFGHVEPTTCNMRLEVPFGPLDPDRALQAVRGIEMKLLSQTPLAEAILAAGDDLAQAGRSRTIILITDGVESCDGDPVEAVRELRSRNPVEVAIVSLGIPEEQIEAFNALAEAVNASYVDVTSFEQLQESVTAALNPAFEVFGPDGELVATGVVDGPPVELERGVYTVRVFGAGVREYSNVQVPGGSSTSLTHVGN